MLVKPTSSDWPLSDLRASSTVRAIVDMLAADLKWLPRVRPKTESNQVEVANSLDSAARLESTLVQWALSCGASQIVLVPVGEEFLAMLHGCESPQAPIRIPMFAYAALQEQLLRMVKLDDDTDGVLKGSMRVQWRGGVWNAQLNLQTGETERLTISLERGQTCLHQVSQEVAGPVEYIETVRSAFGILLRGTPEFNELSRRALKLIALQGRTQEIESCIGSIIQSGVDLDSRGASNMNCIIVGEPTWTATTIWYAGRLIFAAKYRSHRRSLKWSHRVFRESRSSMDSKARSESLKAQLDFLLSVQADAHTIEFVASLIERCDANCE